jgi:hypothetical protein
LYTIKQSVINIIGGTIDTSEGANTLGDGLRAQSGATISVSQGTHVTATNLGAIAQLRKASSVIPRTSRGMTIKNQVIFLKH